MQPSQTARETAQHTDPIAQTEGITGGETTKEGGSLASTNFYKKEVNAFLSRPELVRSAVASHRFQQSRSCRREFAANEEKSGADSRPQRAQENAPAMRGSRLPKREVSCEYRACPRASSSAEGRGQKSELRGRKAHGEICARGSFGWRL